MLNTTGLIAGHYECRSLDETLPVFTDLLAMWNSMALIDEKALFKRDHVLPGHDSKVFRQPCYPDGQ